jgi:fatty acid-binding protein DegV
MLMTEEVRPELTVQPEVEPRPRPLTVVVDDTADIPPEWAQQMRETYGVDLQVVPVMIVMGEGEDRHEYESTADEPTWPEIKKAINSVTTSVVPSDPIFKHRLKPAMDGGNDALILTLPGGFSSFADQFTLAARMWQEQVAAQADQEEYGQAQIVPTNGLSITGGYMAYEAARLSSQGDSLAEIVRQMEDLRSRMVIVATLDKVGRASQRLPSYVERFKGVVGELIEAKATFVVNTTTGETEAKGTYFPRLFKGWARAARKESLSGMVGQLPVTSEELEPLSPTNDTGEPYLFLMADSGISERDFQYLVSLLQTKYPNVPDIEKRIFRGQFGKALKIYLDEGAIGLMAVRKRPERESVR